MLQNVPNLAASLVKFIKFIEHLARKQKEKLGRALGKTSNLATTLTTFGQRYVKKYWHILRNF